MPLAPNPSQVPVASPCIGLCTLDTASVCQGCGRHIDEIMQWPTADDATRLQIRLRAERRRLSGQGEGS